MIGGRIASEIAPLTLVSGYCSISRHGRCDGSRGGGDVWPCYCSCHFPDSCVSWPCSHRNRSSDPPPPPPTPQTHPWAYTRSRRKQIAIGRATRP